MLPYFTPENIGSSTLLSVKRIVPLQILLVIPLIFILVGCEDLFPGKTAAVTEGHYETILPTEPDGSGKVYLGREIAEVLDTPEVPEWLERPDRESEEFPNRVIQALELRPTDVVADIGAGTGYFSFRFSPYVPDGLVLAVDIQQDMLDIIKERQQGEGVANIAPILGTITNPNLPADSVDLAIIISSYHEFSNPREMMENIVAALRPGGRFVLVEYRGEDPTIPVSSLRRMTQDQAIKEMRHVGLRWKETKDFLPQQHFLIFEKPRK
ncbi:MAG: class I SAM-dependent methyltransferase [Rhodothermales bacterium]